MKEALRAHAEKFAAGLCIGLMAWLFYAAAAVEPYHRTPEDFVAVAQRARANVRNNDPQLDGLAPPDFPALQDAVNRTIDPAPYQNATPWVRQFDFGKQFRREPHILTPGRPIVQDNRGLINLFATGPAGERLVRKVPRKDSVFPRRAGRVAGVPGQMQPDGLNPNGDFDPAQLSLMQGNEIYFESVVAEAAPTPIAPQADRAVAIHDRQRRFVLPRELVERRADDKKPKNRKAEEELVDEYVVEMQSKHWVEIVASFPHSEQIREYVQALREPAGRTGLRYALAEVQRRELKANHEWSSWKAIDLKEQFRVVQNAIRVEPEDFPQVMLKGLAMNIPALQTCYKPFLSLPEFEEPKRALYLPEELDPARFAPKKPKRRFVPVPNAILLQAQAKKAAKPKTALPKSPLLQPQNQVVNLAPADAKKDDPRSRFDNRYEIQDAMIRFWDFTVVPKMRYQYRVRVRVFNPNYLRDDVADSATVGREFLTGAWSEPSSDVMVEPDVHWYVTSRSAGSRDSSAAIEIHRWAGEMGTWITNEFQIRPGSLIGRGGKLAPNVVLAWDSEREDWNVEEKVLASAFDTQSVLLEVWGGRVRTGKSPELANVVFNVPKEAIAVNEFGDLVRHDADTDEKNEIRQWIAARYAEVVEDLCRRMEEAAKRDAGRLAPAAPNNRAR